MEGAVLEDDIIHGGLVEYHGIVYVRAETTTTKLDIVPHGVRVVACLLLGVIKFAGIEDGIGDGGIGKSPGMILAGEGVFANTEVEKIALGDGGMISLADTSFPEDVRGHEGEDEQGAQRYDTDGGEHCEGDSEREGGGGGG